VNRKAATSKKDLIVTMRAELDQKQRDVEECAEQERHWKGRENELETSVREVDSTRVAVFEDCADI
jgi:hypothetical protein